MSLAALTRGSKVFAAAVPATRAAVRHGDWRPGFEFAHRRAVMVLMAALLTVSLVVPATLAGHAGGAALLVGGALIGMPHGSSDFVVAHRLLGPRLHAWWLPAFLVAYLAVTAAVLLGWRLAPVTTLVGFLAVSALHFGASRDDPVHSAASALRMLARAITPVVPIFLFHPADVAGIIGLMCGRPATTIVAALDAARPAGLTLYLALLVFVMAQAGSKALGRETPSRSGDATELVLLAAAAYLLPPLLVFALYFCLLHAVRHMVELGHLMWPDDGRRALGLAAGIVGPSSLICGLALAFTWDAMAGALTTERLLAIALQVTASLTVPHVLLESWAGRNPAPA